MADSSAPLSAGGVSAVDALTNASLRIIILAHGSNRGDDILLVFPLDSTVSELKERLRQLIAGNPPIEQQRLIYYGRPLLDGNATLRSILRAQEDEQNTHVIHLVIRSNAGSIPPSAPSLVSQQAGRPVTQAHTPIAAQGSHIPQAPQIPMLHPHMLDPAHLAEHANMMQQHMAIHNQHLANLQQHMPQGNTGDTNPEANNTNSPQPAGANTHPVQDDTRLANGSVEGTATAGQSVNEPHASHQAHPNVTMRVQETIGPNGERTRIITNSTGPMYFPPFIPPAHVTPVERSASAPGSAERDATSAAPQPRRSLLSNAIPSIASGMPQRPMFLPRAMPNPVVQPHLPTQSANPTAWLLSSPSGPQALLFSPNHGYFTTRPVTIPDVATDPSRVVQQGQGIQSSASSRPATQTQAIQLPRTDVVLRPQDQPQPVNVAQAERPNRNGGDIAAFILQRGWLFIRLYMFIFVLSEPGTWRRIILLGLATLVCFLPRQNPLTDAFQGVRRHFDRLIGPPRLPQLPIEGNDRHPEPPNAVAPDNNAPAQRQNRPATMPTPEEHARRLLQQHQDRNPSFIRGILQPVEQAVALFLASLIPGVGERHIRAREEARRLMVEAEQQRQQAQQEAERAANGQGNDNEVAAPRTSEAHGVDIEKKVEPSAPEPSSNVVEGGARSTAVDASTGSPVDVSSTDNEGIRQRTGDSN